MGTQGRGGILRSCSVMSRPVRLGILSSFSHSLAIPDKVPSLSQPELPRKRKKECLLPFEKIEGKLGKKYTM
jgi:hypothetical protein